MKATTINHLGVLFGAGTLGAASDALLVQRFVQSRDALAFEVIVARHGPMVYHVCRRMLREQSDVEDAFQATFLILVRRASTLRDTDRLRTWLYGVAQRVARRLRAQAALRRTRERRVQAAAPPPQFFDEIERHELLTVIDEELIRLPEKHRAAVVRCDLEGASYEQAARDLDCPLGTLKTRLAAGRKGLRARLIRRGIAPATAGVVSALATGSTRAAVPMELSASTVRSALQYAVGSAAMGGSISTAVSTLTEGVIATMGIFRVKMFAAAACVVIAAGTATFGVFAQHPGGSKYDEPIRQLEERLSFLKEIRRREAETERARADAEVVQARTAEKLRKLGATIERDVVAVNLAGTGATDSDLALLSAFTNLQTLHLHHTKITDSGLESLKGLHKLTTLDVFDTQVTDAGLEHLAEWTPRLEWLELSETAVTNACLRSLVGLKHLGRLDLRKTRVSRAAAAELRRALPVTEILH
jgi:RNA polymerase sigma factor (sigma-70 family)